MVIGLRLQEAECSQLLRMEHPSRKPLIELTKALTVSNFKEHITERILAKNGAK